MIHSTHRFHGRSSLRYVYQQGRAVHAGALSLRFVRNNREQRYRAAVVVSRKVSKSAVVRNRLRRRIFEVVRRDSGRFNGPWDLVFTVQREELENQGSDELQQTVHDLLRRAGVFKGQTPTDHGIVEGKET